MKTGELGEEVVAQWLLAHGGKILHRRWRWKRGEIDLIAVEAGTLLFIEVKTRNRQNWDNDGLLAVTPQKQTKIIRTAELFLVKYPYLAEYACRFDVAIVRHQPLQQAIVDSPLHVFRDPDANECLLLINYIPGAFEYF
jgi:putative endonuclease